MAEELNKVKKHWQDAEITKIDEKKNTRLAAARKELIRILNRLIDDNRHFSLDQRKNTTTYLLKILNNVIDFPMEQKYRSIRISNPTFGKYIRNVPGGEEFLITCGFHASVKENEKYFIFAHDQSETTEWQILLEGQKELKKLDTLLASKIEKSSSSLANKKADIEKRKKEVIDQLEEDKERRSIQFRYSPGGST